MTDNDYDRFSRGEIDVKGGVPVPAKDESDEKPAGRRSQATELVDLALAMYDIGMSTGGEPFAVPTDGRPKVARLLRGHESVRSQLAAQYSDDHGRAPSASALTDALAVLEGLAYREAPRVLHLRVARHEGRLVLDLARPDGEVVIVEAGRWYVTQESPVLFHKTTLTSPLPIPLPGGNLGELRKVTNISDRSWPCVLAWEICVLMPGLGHPILSLIAEQGHGKSSTQRPLVDLLDPSPVPLRAMPRDLEQWAVTAAASTVVAVDNVSMLPWWLSDALCRSATGEGLLRRRLYTDSDVSVLSFRRAVVLSSIDIGALRGDLGERLVPVELEPITPERRRTDEDLAATWTRIHPTALGGVLDLAAQVLAVLPTRTPKALPRMADYGRVLDAVDAILGTSGMAYYSGSEERVAHEVLESEPVAAAVQALLGEGGAWEGTFGELLDRLTDDDRRKSRGWPRTARGLSGILRRIAPALRKLGYEFEETGRAAGGRTLRLQAPEEAAGAPGCDGGEGRAHRYPRPATRHPRGRRPRYHQI